MKRLLLITLLLAWKTTWAVCDYKTAGLMIGTHVVSSVKALNEQVTLGKCKVRFVVSVDSPNELYEVKETVVDSLAKGSDLCHVAIRNGIEKLLLKLGKSVDTDEYTVCREGKKIKANDSIFEDDVGRSKISLYFKYQNMRCRNFTEHYYDNANVKSYFGVICQSKANESQWTVMDKW